MSHLGEAALAQRIAEMLEGKSARAAAAVPLAELQQFRAGAAPPRVAPSVPPGPPVTGGCRWPIGEPRQPGFRLCDAPRSQSRCPYCPEHAALAYAPPRPPAAPGSAWRWKW